MVQSKALPTSSLVAMLTPRLFYTITSSDCNVLGTYLNHQGSCLCDRSQLSFGERVAASEKNHLISCLTLEDRCHS